MSRKRKKKRRRHKETTGTRTEARTPQTTGSTGGDDFMEAERVNENREAIAAEEEPVQEGTGQAEEPSGPAGDGSSGVSGAREVAELRRQLELKNDQFLRLAADFKNYKARIAKEKERERHAVHEQIFSKILVVFDSMDRAKQAIEDGDDIEHLREGLERIYDLFMSALSDLGVKPIEALGKPFDPTIHEAMMNMPAPGAEPGTVTAELQKGWLINDKVLRPSRVGVAPDDGTSAPGDGPAAPDGDDDDEEYEEMLEVEEDPFAKENGGENGGGDA